MTTLRLPDGSAKDAPKGATARQIAEGIGKRLAQAAVAARVDGEIVDLARELPDDGEHAFQILTEKDGEPSIPLERATEMAKTIPLRRLATPDDLASLVLWLGSAANTYVSGETISLTGGDQR